MAVLGIGTAAGLVFALPVRTGSVACPPAHEGRTNCLLQHAWAPAFVKVVAVVFAVWLLFELLAAVPRALRRWRSGERPIRRAADHGRDAVLGDTVLAAATWGIVPESRKATWTVVRPIANPAAAAALAAAPVIAPAPEPVATGAAVPEPIRGVRALTAAERAARGGVGPIRVLSAEESRVRRLRRGNDPALVVSCWSDASSARALPDEVAAAPAAGLRA